MMFKLSLVLAFLFSCVFTNTFAQTVGCNILDASIDWTLQGGQYEGTLSVFLTDTIGLSGIRIDIGSEEDTFNLATQEYLIGGNSFGSNGFVNKELIHCGIGTYSYHENYYVRIRILLSNDQYNEINIHTKN